MILLFGPCMLVAPFLVVLIPVAIVLWPPVLVIVGVLWLITWPLAAAGVKKPNEMLGRWFIILLRPWRYFDVPTKPAGQATDQPPPPASQDGPGKPIP